MPRAIPERQFIYDSFEGFVARSDDDLFLSADSQTQAEIVSNGIFVIRYGIHFLGKPHLALIPGLVALDYGEMLMGEAAWDFVTKHSNLHPRADVVGYRNDGAEEMIPVKNLDVAVPIMTLVYADILTWKPIAEVKCLVANIVTNMPERLLTYLPHYSSIAEWRGAKQ